MASVGTLLSWDKPPCSFPMALDKHCIGGVPGNCTSMILIAIVEARACPFTGGAEAVKRISSGENEPHRLRLGIGYCWGSRDRSFMRLAILSFTACLSFFRRINRTKSGRRRVASLLISLSNFRCMIDMRLSKNFIASLR